MIAGAKRLLQARRAVSSDFEEPVGELGGMFDLHPFKPFTDSFSNGFGHTLSGKPGQLPSKFVGVFVFDVETNRW